MAALHAHGAGYAHLRLSLRGEHCEYEEDEHNSGYDREAAEYHENRADGTGCLVRKLKQLLFDGPDGQGVEPGEQPESLEGRLLAAGTLGGGQELGRHALVGQEADKLGGRLAAAQQVGRAKEVVPEGLGLDVGRRGDQGVDHGRVGQACNETPGYRMVGQQAAQTLSHLVGQINPFFGVAAVGHYPRVDLAGLVEDALCRGQGKESGWVVAGKAAVPRHTAHLQRGLAGLRVDDDGVAHGRLQLFGSLLVQVGLIGAEVLHRQGTALGVVDRAEHADRGRVDSDDPHVAFALATHRVHCRHAFAYRRGKAVDAGVAIELRRQGLVALDGEVRVAADVSLRRLAREEHFVYLAERLDHRVAYAVVDGVAGAHGRGDDERAEH